MEEFGTRHQGENEVTGITTFPVDLSFELNKENITISTDRKIQVSQEEIMKQALASHSQGKILDAAKYYQLLINQGFNDSRILCNYATILKDLDRLDEAEIVTRKAIKLNSNLVTSYFLLALILIRKKKLSDAAKALCKTIELNPDFEEAHSNLGSILRDLGNLKEAEISTRKAIEINPYFEIAHVNLGIILRDLGKLEEAELSLLKAIEINPSSSISYLHLAGILELNNKLEEAKKSYNKAKSLDKDIDLDMNFASIYLLNNDAQNALIQINKFLETNPTDTRAIAYKTIALRGINKFNQAEDLINFTKLVRKFYSQNLINENIFEFNKQFRDSLLSDPRRKTEDNLSGWAIRGGTVIRELFDDTNNQFIFKFKFMLDKVVDLYIRNLPINSNHPFLLRKIDKLSIKGCWVNFLEPGDFQVNHIHDSAWLSGVYYLDEPIVEEENENAGWIEFNRSGYNLPHFGGENGIELIRPEVGMFILFPSYIWHGTIPFSASYTRGSISFDISI